MDSQEIFLDDANSPPDEYARINSLSIDSRIDVSLLLAHFQQERAESLSGEVINDASLPQLHVPRLIYQSEQLTASKESDELLGHVDVLGREENQALHVRCHIDLEKLKLEHPLLRSDPEYDCLELAQRVEKERSSNIDLMSVPSEPLNASEDESLGFPESTYQYKQKLAGTIQEEKLDIPKETLRYLALILKDEWTQAKQHDLLDKASNWKGLRDLAITPPLSPIVQHEDHFIPDDEVCQIPISSDPSTLFDTDLKMAEADLLERDSCHLDSPLTQNFESAACSRTKDSPLHEPKRQSIDSLKVEGPLTPLGSLLPSSDPGIDMSEFTASMDIDQILDEKQPSLVYVKDQKDHNGISRDDNLAALESIAASVRRRIEQEQLQTADAIARVEIPTMDFSIPPPSWQQIPLDALSQLEWIEKTCDAFNVPPWPKNSKVERELRWSPFPPKLAHISVDELIEDDGSVKVLLDVPGVHDVPTSADYVWKQPGLAILRELEDEEELLAESVDDGGDEDIEVLVRKRKLESSNINLGPGDSSSSLSPVDLIPTTQNTSPALCSTQIGSHGQTSNLLLGYDDPFATSTLLSNYVDFRTSKRQKNTQSSFFPSIKTAVQAERKVIAKPGATSQAETSEIPKPNPDHKPTALAPCPQLKPITLPLKVIKALTLERGVFSRLEKLYPNIEFIERDFDRWNSLVWARNSVSRSPVVSPLASEADVIISPVTGIVVTTLLKAMQKPPPGHKGLSAIRERIHSVALRYERLIVLVSEGNRVDETTRELTTSESAAYSDFAGFVAGVNTNAQTNYVGGGDETLAKWLVSFLIRYAPEAAEVRDIIIQDETLWELFLRRAGMNAYAAQAILGQLRHPDDIPEEEAGKYGLPAFIKMTPVERIQMFRAMIGGERVLHRVNEVIETRWN
ncbi:hypothetical protein F5Y05DRAFT_420967 [Hypoxylon sp. FL0543]|nr:hypothetical protein F5Y05DRAFT_420967 [Hypoxylon sp. FL0543]